MTKRKASHVRTNVVIDEALIRAGLKATGLKTRRDLIDFALRDLLRRKSQRALMDLKGSIAWDGDLDAMRTTETG
jgi:Arc/MetJ family transcription regulator